MKYSKKQISDTYATWTTGEYPKGQGFQIAFYALAPTAFKKGWKGLYHAYHQSMHVDGSNGYRTLKEAKEACSAFATARGLTIN